MKRVALDGRIRHTVLIDDMSRREAARVFGIDRRTVEKMLVFSVPPGCRPSQAGATFTDACFVKAYPAETTEAFCDGHMAAFEFFGGVPISILYDNIRIAVARILGDGARQHSRVFSDLISHSNTAAHPAKNNPPVSQFS